MCGNITHFNVEEEKNTGSHVTGMLYFFSVCVVCSWHHDIVNHINGEDQFLAGWCSPEQMPLADQHTFGFFPL